MADENIDLRFLAEQGKRILDELSDVRAEQKGLAPMLGKVSDAVTAIAARQDHHSKVLTHHSELLGQILETRQSYGGRLNVIDSRLALIERHTGMVKA